MRRRGRKYGDSIQYLEVNTKKDVLENTSDDEEDIEHRQKAIHIL